VVGFGNTSTGKLLLIQCWCPNFCRKHALSTSSPQKTSFHGKFTSQQTCWESINCKYQAVTWLLMHTGSFLVGNSGPVRQN